MFKKTALTIALLTTLTACNEQGNNSQAQNSPENTSHTPSAVVKTGRLQSVQTSGLKYTSGDNEGVTDELGRYKYIEGDTITFFLGNVKLGTTNGKSNINAADILNKSNLNDEQVSNLITLLRSLDADNNPKNGITISPEMQALAEIFTGIDFSSPNFKADLEALLNTIGKILNPATPKVSKHTLETLACRYSGVFSGTTQTGTNAGQKQTMLVKGTEMKAVGHSQPFNLSIEQTLEINVQNQTAKLLEAKFMGGIVKAPELRFNGFNVVSTFYEDSTDPNLPVGTGYRVGGVFDAVERIVASPSDDAYTGFSVDIDSTGFLSGADVNGQTLTGSKSGNTIKFTTNTDLSFTGSIDTEGKLTGTLKNSEGTVNKSYSGSNCSLI